MMTIDRVSFIAICVVLAPTLLTAFLVIRKYVVEKIKIGNTEKLLNSSKTKSFVSGKKVLITGGNKGIGYSTAIEFCRLGATVLITCRDVEKGRIAIQQIENKVKLASINFKVLDLLELQSVRDFAGEVLLEGTKFDFLINNAGVMLPFSTSKDGYESQFQVNHLGHFLLTRLLIENNSLRKGARIVNVSSEMHRMGKLNFSEMPNQRANKVQMYNNTKMLNILFSNELNNRLKNAKSDITSISVHPGVILTDFHEHFLPKIFYPVVRCWVALIASKSHHGASSILYAALSEDFDRNKNLYLNETTLSKPAKDADPENNIGKENMQKLWKLSCSITGFGENIF